VEQNALSQVTLRAVQERDAQLHPLGRPLAPDHDGNAARPTSTPYRRAFDRVPIMLVGGVDHQRSPVRVREQVELKTLRAADDD